MAESYVNELRGKTPPAHTLGIFQAGSRTKVNTLLAIGAESSSIIKSTTNLVAALRTILLDASQSCVPTCSCSPSLIADARLGLIYLKVAAMASQKRIILGSRRRLRFGGGRGRS